MWRGFWILALAWLGADSAHAHSLIYLNPKFMQAGFKNPQGQNQEVVESKRIGPNLVMLTFRDGSVAAMNADELKAKQAKFLKSLPTTAKGPLVLAQAKRPEDAPGNQSSAGAEETAPSPTPR